MITMFDCIPELIGNVPGGAEAVAGYVNGRYAWTQAEWDRFPKAHKVTISINASTRARMLDVEQLDATPDEAPGWYLHHADHTGGLPIIYCAAGTSAAVLDAMARAGIARSKFLLLSAHVGRGEHVCGPHTCGYPQADGTQWTWTVDGRDLDQSILSDRFFVTPPPRPRGRANFHGYYDLATGHWVIIPDKGDVVFDHVDRQASAELQINVRTGHWRVRAIPWNSPPLGR